MSVTPLTTLANAAIIFEINSGDESQNNILNLLISEASQIITSYCHRADFGVNTYTATPQPWNTGAITLTQLPVLGLSVTGTLTQGSAAITNLASATFPAAPTTGLFVGQSLMGAGIPAAAVITSLGTDSLTFGVLVNGAVTASAATASAAGVTVAFGIAVWVDAQAYGGWGAGSLPGGAFAPGTQLVEGQGYWLQYDMGPGTPCTDGIVHAINCAWLRWPQWVWGLITPQNGPPPGSIRAVYTAGYSAVPPDVQAAAESMLAHMRLIGAFGRATTNMSDGRLSVGLSNEEKWGLLTPQVRSMLAPYVITSLGAA